VGFIVVRDLDPGDARVELVIILDAQIVVGREVVVLGQVMAH
jgi:hypothetical protein